MFAKTHASSVPFLMPLALHRRGDAVCGLRESAAGDGLGRRGVGLGEHPLDVREGDPADRQVLNAAHLEQVREHGCDGIDLVDCLPGQRPIVQRANGAIEEPFAGRVEPSTVALKPVRIAGCERPLAEA